MLYSKVFSKSKKSSKDFESLNASLLQKAGFIDQTMAGVFTFLPFGVKVLTKIERIVRDEMNKVANEVLMPTLAPTSLWELTGRLNTVDVLMKTTPANDVAREKNDAEYVISPTHEEIITPLVQKFAFSYKDLPVAAYQIQTKFRNETRPKSGLLRGREFRMKDLYSFHTSKEDFKNYYDNIQTHYMNIYHKLGLGKDTFIALASGGDFTKDYSHEFQTKCENGEDWIFYVPSTNTYYNKEVAPTNTNKLAEPGDVFPETGEKYEVFKASEVGNIFTLDTKYTKAFDFTYTDENGEKKPIYMGCYGIGVSRIMGVIVEKFNDDKGIIWPVSVAPFTIHLVGLNLEEPAVLDKAFAVYYALLENNIEVLFDDRKDIGAGEKFGDADLIGCPFRLVVSKKTTDKVEIKKRSEDNSQTEDLTQFINYLKTL